VLSFALVLPLTSSVMFQAAAQDRAEGDDLYKYLSVFTEVLRLVRSVYVEETDLPTLMAGALDGAADALDPFSVYVPASQIDSYRKAKEVGRSRSGMVVLKERGIAFVVAVDENGPAAGAGVEQRDIISKIQGISTRAMPQWQILEYLTAEPGAEVELELIRRGATMEATLALAEYQPPGVSVQQVRGIDVLRVPEIDRASLERLDQLLAERRDARLLIDLRGSAGGDAEAAYELAERFVDGALGELVNGDETLERFESDGSPSFGGEVSVLVDSGSQGAAEIVAAVLQQSEKAQILGERTFGHAGRSTLVKLGSGAYLDLTEAYYTGPDGSPLSEGLEPDLPVRVGFFGEDESDGDAVLDKALDLLLDDVEEEDERSVA
jgi:carboxyl-terminal processing protease